MTLIPDVQHHFKIQTEIIIFFTLYSIFTPGSCSFAVLLQVSARLMVHLLESSMENGAGISRLNWFNWIDG